VLTDVKVAKSKYTPIRSQGAKNAGQLLLNRLPDRDGLYLAITPPPKDDRGATFGSKSWRYDFQFPPSREGARQCLTYGRYPEMTLAEARDEHLKARRLLAKGINPAAQKQIERRGMLTALDNVYEKIAQLWFDAEKPGKPKSWMDNNERWMKLVNKTLGAKPIDIITHNDCYNAIRPLENDGYAFSAERARQQIAQVFAYAIRKRLHTGSNPARELDGEIKVPEHKNHRHIKEREIAEFLKAVDGSKATEQTKIASRLLLLTIVRKQELLAAKLTEFDLDAGMWEIPGERMKNRLPHICVPRQTGRSLWLAMLLEEVPNERPTRRRCQVASRNSRISRCFNAAGALAGIHHG
jgi:integrase